MNITIKHDWDMGRFITVQSGYIEDGEFILEHCNHDGASETGMWSSNSDDAELEDTLVCDKCDKWYNEVDGSWEQP